MSRSNSKLIVRRRLAFGMCATLSFFFSEARHGRASFALLGGEWLRTDVGPYEGQRYAQSSIGRSPRRSRRFARVSPLLEE